MKKILGMLLIFSLIASVGVFADENLGLKVGKMAPDFNGIGHNGQKVSLSGNLADGPVVLLFYRGGWCMYCNLQLQEYQRTLSEFKKLGASVIAISVDKQEMAQNTVEEKQLGFQVISDPEAGLLESYNVIFHVPADLSAMYKENYSIDLEAASGRDDGLIAVPATYVIKQSREIVYAYANEDYKVRPKAKDILKVLEEL